MVKQDVKDEVVHLRSAGVGLGRRFLVTCTREPGSIRAGSWAGAQQGFPPRGLPPPPVHPPRRATRDGRGHAQARHRDLARPARPRPYSELGADHFAKRDPERAIRRMIKKANSWRSIKRAVRSISTW
jgi:hypothetical protein